MRSPSVIKGIKGFKVLPRRWIVERTFGRLVRNRRLGKDYERMVQTGEALAYIATTLFLLRWSTKRRREAVSSVSGSAGWVVLSAPSNLGLSPPRPGAEPGCKRLAATLREAGIAQRLGAADAGTMVPPPYSPEWDGKTVRNARAIVGYSRVLADRVNELLDERLFPLVLGGDCSILLGNMLALRKRGHFGLAFLDGHLDFRHPGNSEVVGAAAGEDLALVTGRGAPELTDPDGLGPLVRDGDVVALGERENDPETSDVQETEITVLDLRAVRRMGVAAAAGHAVASFERSELDGFWVHVDADVLDNEVMPAVDSPQPGGLSRDELIEMLRVLFGSELAVGMEVTIFDPELDPDGTIAAAFADDLVSALRAS
jgi:arginase